MKLINRIDQGTSAMTACPSQDQLRQLLDDRLIGLALAEMVGHIEVCPFCHAHLEALTRENDWKTTLDEVSGETGTENDAFAIASAPPKVENDQTADVIRVAEFEAATDDTEPVPRIGSTDEVTGDFGEVGSDRTGSQMGPRDRSPTVKQAGSRTDCPDVPGYEVLERLGEGGMGVVHKARQLGLNRLVALKMIRGGSHARADHFVRFAIEAEAVAKLRHPNILLIYDIGEVGDLPYVALELLEGGSLADHMGGTPQPGIASAELLVTLARAVQVAHQAGIIHRDLKPSNVLYTSDGVPKITDFGLAKRIDSDDQFTESGQIMGSPSYMAPEQARGHTKDVGPAADVYALGAILYEMLTGRPPFKGESPIETVRQVIDDDPVPPSRLVPRLSRDLETICLKCLNKETHKRYDSAQALADDLERYRKNEPIKARPTPFWEHAAKWAKRHPLRAAACVLGILLSSGLIGGGFAYEHNLRIAAQNLAETILDRLATGSKLLERADAARSFRDLDQVQEDLAAFAPRIENEPRLKDLSERIAEKRKQISNQRVALQSEQAKRDRLHLDRERFQKFRELRNEAQLYAAKLMVLDPAEHQKALFVTALAALAVYGQDPQAPATQWSLVQPLPDALDAKEKDEVKGGCHDLLLSLSEAMDPAEGLKVMDRAARLVPEPTVGYHLLRAALLVRTNDAAGQAREQQLAANLKPSTAFDHLLIGREQSARDQNREAVRSSLTAIQLDPNQLGAQLLLARLYFNSQRYSESKNSLNTCIRTAPNLLGLYLFRALVSGEQGNRALLAIKETPALAAEWRLEADDEFNAAEVDYQHALELRPDLNYRYVLLVNRGGLYLHAGQLDRAIADLEAAVQLNDKPYHAHALLAQIYQRQGRLDQAALSLDRAIERQSDRPDLFRARALLVARPDEKAGDRARVLTPAQRALAIRDLEQAIRLEPNNSLQKADDHAERGRLLFASGQIPEALAAYDAALRIVPDDLKALRLRTLALLELERYDDVLSACDAFLAKGKPSADLLEIRGQARLARKDFGGAISDYTVAMSLTPDSAALSNRRGWAYLFSDAFKLALADFNAAVRIDPGLGHAYSGRGLALVSLGRWRDAVAEVETAVQLSTAGLKQQALYNAARVHALSLKFAADDVSRHGEAGLSLYRRLRDRASALLVQSIHQLPTDRQALFWRDVVATDPVLRPFIPK
jgi:eukaryotic-like serine/threonine-protein kinase